MSAGWETALARLRGTGGKRFWRGLDELLDVPAFRAKLADEFPALARGPADWERRDILRCMGASLALAGLAGCEAEPDERSMPYVRQPEGEVPGRFRQYASAVVLGGWAQPVVGSTFSGRPTKLEGNPDHPASRGVSDAFLQAALLDLYDPDRSQSVRYMGRPSSWSALDGALVSNAAALDATKGAGLRILTGQVTSPTTIRQLDALLKRWPQARWHLDEPAGDAGRIAGTALAFGRPLHRIARFDRAEAVVAFDDAPLDPGPAMVANSLGWSIRRRGFQAGDGAATLLVAEPTPTLTGARAERRLIAAPDRVPALVEALAAVFGVGGATRQPLTSPEQNWLERAAKALAAAKGRGLVLVDGGQPAAVQALGFAIDERLGNLAATSRFIDPPWRVPAGDGSLATLVADMAAGRVSRLVVLDANPAHASPLAARFRAACDRVPFRLHIGRLHDETAQVCQWHAPTAHELESWGDARAIDGTAAPIQPLVRPFFDVRGRAAMLAALGGDLGGDDLAIVRASWPALDDAGWRAALVKGVLPDDGAAAAAVRVGTPPTREAPPPRPAPTGAEHVHLLVRPDPTIWDGRFAANPWQQELPKPFTTLTWDNAVIVAPALAARLGVADGDLVRLSAGGVSVEGPVLALPGQAADTVLVHLGYGRHLIGEVADGAGFDAYPLAGHATVAIAKASGRRELARTQEHHAIDGTDLVKVVATPFTRVGNEQAGQPNFMHRQPVTNPSWGMAIDLDLCTGCGACVTACNAENNIPMVGREQVAMGRELHWMRVDRYFEGPAEDPVFHNQPLPCMHCEDAPCEMGCPVNATVHSPEGLNLQVYNRCIGTRTCSSFCPYKVRRFNFYGYAADQPEVRQAQRNPNVTVRARGVMEKCTFCIQRISAARIDAKLANESIPRGGVKTACQQACPTGAISFGNLADHGDEVVARKASPRDYTLLPEANTRPRTSYQARIRPEDEA